MGNCHCNKEGEFRIDLISTILVPISLEEVPEYNKKYAIYDENIVYKVGYKGMYKPIDHYAIVPLEKSILTTPENTAVRYNGNGFGTVIVRPIYFERVEGILNRYEVVWYRYVPGETVYVLKTRDKNINRYFLNNVSGNYEFVYCIVIVPEQEVGNVQREIIS